MRGVSCTIASMCIGWGTLVSTAAAFPSYAAFKLNNGNSSDPQIMTVAPLGDMNHDGHPDIGAAWWDQNAGGHTEAGVLNVFTNYGSTPSWSLQGGQNGAHLGWRFTSLGDINGDSTDDFAMSVIRKDTTCVSVPPSPAGDYTAEVDVVSGATHNVLYSIVGNVNGAFGEAVAAMGDVNGDGVPDFVIDGPYNYQPTNNHCTGDREIAIYSGANGSRLANRTITLLGGSGSVDGGEVTNVGDVNGDGTSDFAIVAPYTGASSAVIVYSGVNVSTLTTIVLPPYNTVYGIAKVGDVDGDTHPDIAVATDNLLNIYSGASASLIRSISVPNVQSVSALGDMDGDGITDLVVFSGGVGGAGTGFVQILSGHTGASLAKIMIKARWGGGPVKITSLGLIDGDTYPDFALSGQNYSDSGLFDAYVFLSGTPNPHDPLLFSKDSFYRIGPSFYNF